MNFVAYSSKYFDERGEKRDQKFLLTKFSTDDERLAYVIDRRKRRRHFLPYAPWLISSACHPVKFEDLFVELKQSADGKLGTVLLSLIKYLELNPDSIDPVKLYDSVYNKSRTANEERNKIGNIKSISKKKITLLIDNPELIEIL